MSKNEIKLVVSDVDGTLIGKDMEETEDLKKLGEMIEEKNICLSIASGRAYASIEGLVSTLKLKNPLIINNGAVIINEHNQVIDEVYFGFESVKALVELADSMDFIVLLSTDKGEFVFREHSYAKHKLTKDGIIYKNLSSNDDLSKLKIYKLQLTDGQKEGRVDTVLSKLDLSGIIKTIRYNSRFADIMPKDAGKYEGIVRLAKYLGIEIKEVMAIGDAKNDMEMVKNSGFGVAVGNAAEELKDIADYVCENPYAKGVIEAIKLKY